MFIKARRRIPIGVQSFVSLRTESFLYADKTAYIYDLMTGSKQYFLSRPRRFGKSLFLSTLKAFWEGKKELFAGLKISELMAAENIAWQAYPVLYFDFNGKNYQGTQALEEVLSDHLSDWEGIYGGDGDKPLEKRFRNILRAAKDKTGLPCVVLVDEYDKSLLETMENNALLEHNKAVFKGFFGNLKSCDEHLRFVFITGVTKFSKVSIFSDLNQLRDISFTENFASICGITEQEMADTFTPEIEALAVKQNFTVSECYEALRTAYDGYHFYPDSIGVYNPFSLLNALAAKDIHSYWFGTGTPTFLTKRLKAIEYNVQNFSNSSLRIGYDELSDYRTDNPDPVPLLYQTGYLTIQSYDKRRRSFVLCFPNHEVRYGLLKSLLPIYTPVAIPGTGKDIYALDDCLETGDTDGMRDILTALFAGIPYNSDNARFEHYFETVIYLVFTLLGQYIKCEVHTAKGRADAIAETPDYVYIFEFKVDKSAAEALAQIENKEYALPYLADKRKLYKIGVNFATASRNLTEWEVRPQKG